MTESKPQNLVIRKGIRFDKSLGKLFRSTPHTTHDSFVPRKFSNPPQIFFLLRELESHGMQVDPKLFLSSEEPKKFVPLLLFPLEANLGASANSYFPVRAN